MVDATKAVGTTGAAAASADAPLQSRADSAREAFTKDAEDQLSLLAEGRGESFREVGGERVVFRLDEKDGLIVRVVDGAGNTIRQIPPEELVALSRRMDEAIGVLFDRKA